MAYVPQGTYQFHLGTGANVGVGIWGVTAGSVLLEHVSVDGRVLAQRTISTSGVARVTSSSLQFTSIVGGTGTGMTVSVCLREPFVLGDVLSVGLQAFTPYNLGQQFSFYQNSSGLTFGYGSAGGILTANAITTTKTSRTLLIAYSWLTQMLTITVQGNIGHCLSAQVNPKRYTIKLPTTAIFQDSPQFVFSIVSNQSNNVQNEVFQQVTPVGLGSISLVFGSPLPGFNTTLNITFTLLQDFFPNKLNADNSSIFLRLPGFTFNSTAIAYQQKIEAFQACCPSQALYVYGAAALGPQVGVRYPLEVQGPFAYAFQAFWRNTTIDHTVQLVSTTSSSHRLSTHPINPSRHHDFSIHPLNPPHPLNTPYHLIVSTGSQIFPP